MNLTATIDGEEQFRWAIDSISERISDWRPVWPEIEMAFFRLQLEQFNTEGARGGQKWAPLSDSYRAWKEKKHPGQPILVLTGRLRRSLTVAGAGGADQIREAEPDSLTLGTRVPYAIYHQRGTPRLKQRPPMQIQRNDMGKFASRMFRYAERVGQEAGFDTTHRGLR